MVSIYVIKLTGNKYYIGKTTNPYFRVEEHFNCRGSAWTTKYKPIKVVEIIKNCDDYDEDKYTLKYMEKYGIDNVRGGSFCEIKMTHENINTIKRMIDGTTDKCYNCGKKEHFASNCPFRLSHMNETSLDCYSYDTESYSDYEESYDYTDKSSNCYRCGRKGHYSYDCYASKHIDGYYL